jgi:hypothetical protein
MTVTSTEQRADLISGKLQIGLDQSTTGHRVLATRSKALGSSADAKKKNEPELARVQDHNDLLKMMRFHLEAPRAVNSELTIRRGARLNLKLITRPTNMGMDLIINVTGHVQDHLLTNRHVDLLPAWSRLPVRNGDVDRQGVS